MSNSNQRTVLTAVSASSAEARSSKPEGAPVVLTYSAAPRGRGPMLDIEVIGKDGKSIVDVALIDTGADVSVFPLHWRKRLGILYSECRRRRVATAGGPSCKLVYLPGVEAVILGRRLPLRATFLNTPVALLGREDFLTAFQITFDHPAERFIIDAWLGQSAPAE